MSGDKPVVIVTDHLVCEGASLVKSVFPSASDEDCETAAAGAFMVMLSMMEAGNVMFGYDRDGPFFAFPSGVVQ